MYLSFFGLQQEPFSIAPDPRFLYLSDKHRDALALLSYGNQGNDPGQTCHPIPGTTRLSCG